MHAEEIKGTVMTMAKVNASGALTLTGPTTSSATIGAATAIPALPAGYLTVNINGVAYKIAYFN